MLFNENDVFSHCHCSMRFAGLISVSADTMEEVKTGSYKKQRILSAAESHGRSKAAAAPSATTLHLYNARGRPVVFSPCDSESKLVRVYLCGPTVYHDAHLGHARVFVIADSIRRVLSLVFGYSVRFVASITDVDDKVFRRARDLQQPWSVRLLCVFFFAFYLCVGLV